MRKWKGYGFFVATKGFRGRQVKWKTFDLNYSLVLDK